MLFGVIIYLLCLFGVRFYFRAEGWFSASLVYRALPFIYICLACHFFSVSFMKFARISLSLCVYIFPVSVCDISERVFFTLVLTRYGFLISCKNGNE